jgi:RNA-directed DNA polymerase
MIETQSSLDVSTKLERIAELARRKPGVSLQTLAHHIDVDWLREAYRRTRKDGAPGVDGQSAEQYAEQLEANLQSLLHRAKSGRYWAPPVRRVHIPKGDGTETRPIGIPEPKSPGYPTGLGGRTRTRRSSIPRTVCPINGASPVRRSAKRG